MIHEFSTVQRVSVPNPVLFKDQLFGKTTDHSHPDVTLPAETAKRGGGVAGRSLLRAASVVLA